MCCSIDHNLVSPESFLLISVLVPQRRKSASASSNVLRCWNPEGSSRRDVAEVWRPRQGCSGGSRLHFPPQIRFRTWVEVYLKNTHLLLRWWPLQWATHNPLIQGRMAPVLVLHVACVAATYQGWFRLLTAQSRIPVLLLFGNKWVPPVKSGFTSLVVVLPIKPWIGTYDHVTLLPVWMWIALSKPVHQKKRNWPNSIQTLMQRRAGRGWINQRVKNSECKLGAWKYMFCSHVIRSQQRFHGFSAGVMF